MSVSYSTYRYVFRRHEEPGEHRGTLYGCTVQAQDTLQHGANPHESIFKTILSSHFAHVDGINAILLPL